jgi:uncharacterized membrane protein
MSWSGIVVLAAGSYALKLIGLAVIGPHATRRWRGAVAVAALLPPAVLSALVAVQTFGGDRALVVDARAAGVAAAVAAAWRRAPFPVVVLVGAAVTALLRQLG